MAMLMSIVDDVLVYMHQVECADVLVLNKMDTLDEGNQEILTAVSRNEPNQTQPNPTQPIRERHAYLLLYSRRWYMYFSIETCLAASAPVRQY